MADIEPELTSEQLPLLDARYAAEAPAEHDARMARYNAAYVRFNDALAQMNSYMYVFAQQRKTQVTAARRAQETTEDASAVSFLEEMIGAFPTQS